MSETYTFQVTVGVEGASNLGRAQLLLANTLAQISHRYSIEDPNKTHQLSPMRNAAPEMLEIVQKEAANYCAFAWNPTYSCGNCTSCKARTLLAKIKEEESTQ